MRKRLLIGLLLPILGVILPFLTPATASAAFNQNNIMSDSIFNASGSMSSVQIDAFLNSFPSSCISQNRGFVSPNVVGYNPSQGFLYGSNVSAGTIIASAANAYDLNPRVLLATLQKEQSLVTGTAGCHYDTPPTQNPCPDPPYGTSSTCVTACQYAGGCVYIAMGYDCPYYCVPNSTGFSKQIIKAAWKLKFVQQRSLGNYNWNIQKPGWDNSDDPATSYDGYMTQGNLKRNASSSPVSYDGYRPVNSGALSVHLDSGATASLYSFTPFTNGNSNFVSIYEGWFGSTNGPTKIVDNPSAVSWADGRIDVFARGTDNGIYQKWYDANAGGWQAWSKLDGTLESAPSVASWGTGRLDIFSKSASGELQHLWYGGGTWGAWDNLGKPSPSVGLASAPGAISWGDGRIDVFVRGTDGELWQKWYDTTAGGWQPWGKIGGVLNSAPTIASWGPGRLDLFSTGPAGDLQHHWFDATAGGWQSWESLGKASNGGSLTSGPGAISWGDGRLDVFARGSDGVLWQKWFSGEHGGWKPWVRFGGVINSTPSVSSWAPGRLDEFSTGPDGDLQHYYFGTNGWGSWESFGYPRN